MSWTIDQQTDVIQATLDQLGEGKWEDLTGDLQEYIALPRLLTEEKVKFQGGTGHKWNIMKSTSGNASRTTPYETDTPAIQDNLIQASVDWAYAKTSYSFARQIINQNKGDRQLLSLIKQGRADADISLANILEEDFFGGIDSSNNKKPLGVQDYICYSATKGFNGTVRSGFTTVAGINPTTYERWRNWTAQYINVTRADAVALVKEGMAKTNFKSPLSPGAAPNYRRGAARREIFCAYDTWAAFVTLAEDQNDSLGHDLDSQHGQVTINRVPLTYVPYLDAQTAALPILGIDFSYFYPVILEGEYMKETVQSGVGNQHTVTTVWKDLTYQYINRNRRAHFLVAKSDWA